MLNGITTGWRSWTRAAAAGRREESTSQQTTALGSALKAGGQTAAHCQRRTPASHRNAGHPPDLPEGKTATAPATPGARSAAATQGAFSPPRSPRVRTTRLRQTRTTELNASESKGSVLTPMPDEPRHNRRDAPFAVSQAHKHVRQTPRL